MHKGEKMPIVQPEYDKKSKNEDFVPVLVKGDVKIEDDIMTDEEINAMTEDDKEIYNRYKSNALRYRKVIYEDLIKLSRYFKAVSQAYNIESTNQKFCFDKSFQDSKKRNCDLAKSFEVVVDELRDQNSWSAAKMKKLLAVLIEAEEVCKLKNEADLYLVEAATNGYVQHDLPVKIQMGMSLIYPNFQYHMFKTTQAEEQAKREAIAADKAARKEAARKAREEMMKPREIVCPAAPEKEKKFKDYWKGFSKDEQISEISRIFTLCETYVERHDLMMVKLEKQKHPNYNKIAKIYQDLVEKLFCKGKDGWCTDDYMMHGGNGEYIRDEKGFIQFDANKLNDKNIKRMFELFENASHVFYKLDDEYLKDITLTKEDLITL